MAEAIPTATQVPGSESSPASYARLLPKIMAVEGASHINVDVMYVVTLIFGYLRRIVAMRDVLSAKLTDFDPTLLDELDDYVRALQHAHGLYLQATKSPVALQDLIDRATRMRDMLLADAVALATRGLLNADSYREVKKNNGHRPLIVDLQILVVTFRERWSEIAGRTAVQPEELDSAVGLIDTLTEAVGTKEHSPAAQEAATAIREKAFTLVVRTYNEIRDAVLYVRRREGDGDAIAPSLYLNRSGNSKKAQESRDPEEAANAQISSAEEGAVDVAAPPPSDLTAGLTANGPFRRAGGEG